VLIYNYTTARVAGLDLRAATFVCWWQSLVKPSSRKKKNVFSPLSLFCRFNSLIFYGLFSKKHKKKKETQAANLKEIWDF
jgi:hypothetical protein